MDPDHLRANFSKQGSPGIQAIARIGQRLWVSVRDVPVYVRLADGACGADDGEPEVRLATDSNGRVGRAIRINQVQIVAQGCW